MTLEQAETQRLYPNDFRFIVKQREMAIDGICPCTADEDETDIRYSYHDVGIPHRTFCTPESHITSLRQVLQ